MKTTELFDGNQLHAAPKPRKVKEPKCEFRGIKPDGTDISVPLNAKLLSQHVLFLGGIGTGKTTAILQVLLQLRQNMEQNPNKNDIMIIFDTKGEFHEKLYRPGVDIVISNDDTATGFWNIFGEIEQNKRMAGNIVEIANTLFQGKIEKTQQPFFPNAAKDLFSAVLTHFIRNKDTMSCDNKSLRDFLFSNPTAQIREMLQGHDDLKAMISYIFDDRAPQTQGVISELQQMAREIFLENFAEKGNLSMRGLVRAKGGKIVFIEYDLGIGNMLTPIYSLLFDMAIKEALSRSKSEDESKGNVYIITDEFSLLPHLRHVDDAVNFGRSFGVKFMIGLQNVNQVFDAYGEDRARSILSGFLTSVAFRVGDVHSKEYVKSLHGENLKMISYTTAISESLKTEIRDANVVEDWDISRLDTGQAIIGLPRQEPFLFKFKE